MASVLVIDDTQEILEILSMYLKINGFLVTTVPSQKKALVELSTHIPDIILLDILLTDADGRELCKKIKQAPETSHIPIILISASPERLITYKEYGADQIAEKPFNFQELLKKMQVLLGRGYR